MKSVSRRHGIRLFTSILLVLVAIPSSAQDGTAAEPLASFLPEVEEVFLEKTGDFPGIGNARVLVRLSEEQVGLLQQETGRADFVAIGPAEDQTILRDDGLGADEAAGDFLFSGIANVDEAELAERADEDALANETARGKVPAFDGRVFIGSEPAEPFDAAGFNAGARVLLTDPIETVTGEVANSEGAQALDAKMAVLGTNPFQDQSLMIVHPSVVTDPARTVDACTGAGNPNGVWTFKHIMTQMANQAASGIDPRTFVENWLLHWGSTQTINTDNVPPRSLMVSNPNSILNQWKSMSGGGPLNLDIAPLRLLAIVSRLDLATTRGGGSGYGTRTGDFLDAGEARFVFGFVLPPGWTNPGFTFTTPINGGPCQALPFSVIVEYRVPKCECKEVRRWARQWVNLSTLPFPSATYNQALERITQQFVRANANPTRPNGSALGQLRTNEVALAIPWELREFQLTQFPFSMLNETTVADNPQDLHNNTPSFGNWVLGPVLNAINTGGFGAPIPPVPLHFAGATPINFLGGKASVPSFGFFWNDASIVNVPNQNQARFRSSFATCGGCHAGEVKLPPGFTPGFVHVDPSSPILPATLSGFLTGINGVPDPAFGTPLRDFDDLARRELDLKRKARMACFRFHPINVALVRSALGKAQAGQPAAATGQLPDDLFAGLEIVPLEEQISVAADALDDPATHEVH